MEAQAGAEGESVVRIEVRPAIPGQQSAQWRCTESPCATEEHEATWHVAWETDQVWADGREHAETVHGTDEVWFRVHGRES